ncbi:MAG: putative zinc-binding metallopeptidase [Vicinamibacterales bacterium]
MAKAPPVPEHWAELPDEQLLDLRLRDLPIALPGSVMQGRIAELQAELDTRELKVAIHYYLAEEWFTPDGATSMAVPFYLAHPRLERLERAQMLAVEGGDYESCMRILRHEAGHVVDNAYRLRRKRQRRVVFGSSAEPYPEFYAPKPYSKSFVMHIDPWYAQSHPDEDFAETFAVWLTPGSDWADRYIGWPAVKKLEYVDALMKGLRGRKPVLDAPTEIEPLKHARTTLRQHYRRKRRHYGVERPAFYDRELRKLFSDAPEHAGHMSAVQFLGRVRRPVRRLVADWTGIYQYTIDQVFEDIIVRCRELNLRLPLPEDQVRQAFTVFLTVQTMNYLHSGRHRVAL